MTPSREKAPPGMLFFVFCVFFCLSVCACDFSLCIFVCVCVLCFLWVFSLALTLALFLSFLSLLFPLLLFSPFSLPLCHASLLFTIGGVAMTRRVASSINQTKSRINTTLYTRLSQNIIRVNSIWCNQSVHSVE